MLMANSPVPPGNDHQLMTGAPPFPADQQVTLANWQDPPFNRWAFRHIRELIPTARISRGAGPARELPAAGRDISSISFRSGDQELTVGEMLASTYTDGFLVLHQGRIVCEQYFNGMTPDTPHLLMSVSKSVVSTVAGIVRERGLLDVAAPVEAIVPELAGTSFQGATVQHLLDMRAGTRFDESYDNPEAPMSASICGGPMTSRHGQPTRWSTTPPCITTASTAARSGTGRSLPTCWAGSSSGLAEPACMS